MLLFKQIFIYIWEREYCDEHITQLQELWINGQSYFYPCPLLHFCIILKANPKHINFTHKYFLKLLLSFLKNLFTKVVQLFIFYLSSITGSPWIIYSLLWFLIMLMNQILECMGYSVLLSQVLFLCPCHKLCKNILIE